ncbi:MAG: metallophosphoesterase family protein [Gemmatimonadetes bacterium]|nr:metallophosphoesterase family protein [Gemmatimonadota bacterium]NNM07117.1 metallophosphoesterase family protein [Gemmatimonadota bacterium]
MKWISHHRPALASISLVLALGTLGGCGSDAGSVAGSGMDQGGSVSEDPLLRFGSDGTFTIVHFTDTQDDHEIDPRTVELMEAVLEDQDPDLVVFTGDNVRSGPENPEEVRWAMDAIAGPVDSRGIPWLVAFGNHDEDHTPETGMNEAAMLEYYMGFPANVNQQGPEGVNGTGNVCVRVFGSDGSTPLLHVWALDSGRYSPDTIAGQSVSADGLRTYDRIRPSQIDWYVRTSREAEARFGAKVPGIMFFHIPLPEFDLMWENRENHGVTGEKNEDVAAGAFNSGLFSAVMDRGDVVGIFVGHDHINDFVGDYFGVKLGYSANVGFGTYGLEGDGADRMRGARVIVVPEDDPGSFETFMVYARDYGIR